MPFSQANRRPPLFHLRKYALSYGYKLYVL